MYNMHHMKEILYRITMRDLRRLYNLTVVTSQSEIFG